MAGDAEPTPLLGDEAGHQRDWHLDIEQRAADVAVHMVVSLCAAVVPARLVGEGQLLDQAMLNQQVQ